MTWRDSVRKRRAVVAVAVAMCGAVPAGSVWADEPVDEPAPTVPDEETPEHPADDVAPETGQVEGATVAVGAPPVPPVVDEPEVAVAAPPVPPAALLEQADAALDLLGDLL